MDNNITTTTLLQGKASAVQFAKEGAKVVLVSRTKEKLEQVVKEITDAGGEAVFVAGDVSKEETNKEMVAMATEKFGQVDICFFNAGAVGQFKLVDTTDEAMDGLINLNMKSVVYGLKHSLPALKASPNKGSVVVNSSVMGSMARGAFPGWSMYAATKAAAEMMVRFAAVEAAEDGTRVNGIAPGIVATNIMGISAEATDGFAADKQLIPRAGRSEEVANFVTFLASDESSFMTGGIHTIDGGWSLVA